MMKAVPSTLAWMLAWAAMIALISPTTPCEYGDTVPMAVIGESLDLKCGITCHSLTYEWYRIVNHSEKNKVEGQTGRVLRVSDNVTSVEEVGGLIYECNCSGSSDCQFFEIGVKPITKLFTSTSVARSGSSVNITCTAEGYPPARSVSNYHMKHPKNNEIDRVLLPNMSGVVHIITEASVEVDSGGYECTVIVTLDAYPNKSLQSDKSYTNLIVYYPPKISSVKNCTISEPGQLAVLECVVNSVDADLKVWVNWTTRTNKTLTGKHSTFREGNMFSLLLYNASGPEGYTCRVFSVHSPNVPEDTMNASVMIKDPSPSTQGYSRSKDDDGNTVIVLSVLLSIVNLIALILVAFFVVTLFYYLRKKRDSVSNFSTNRVMYNNQSGEGLGNVQLQEQCDPTPTHNGTDITQHQPPTQAPLEEAQAPLEEREEEPANCDVESQNESGNGEPLLQLLPPITVPNQKEQHQESGELRSDSAGALEPIQQSAPQQQASVNTRGPTPPPVPPFSNTPSVAPLETGPSSFAPDHDIIASSYDQQESNETVTDLDTMPLSPLKRQRSEPETHSTSTGPPVKGSVRRSKSSLSPSYRVVRRARESLSSLRTRREYEEQALLDESATEGTGGE